MGTAIGASAVDPLHDAHPLSGLSGGALIWLVASTLISVFGGAYIAGLLALSRGGLHGLLSWAATTLITTWLIAGLATSAVSTVSGAVGKGLSLAGSGLAAATPKVVDSVKNELNQQGVQIDWNDLHSQLDTLLRQSGKADLNPDTLKDKANAAASDGQATVKQTAQTPQSATNDITAWFERVRQESKPTIAAMDRDALVNIIAARTGKTHEEASEMADNYVQAYNQAMARYEDLKRVADQKLREAGDAAARGVSRAAWLTLALMLIGALAAFAGGVLGRKSDPMTVE
jgi:ElaB/YqjD/DUF883 family membrane-anchored ribosome-binding protein